VLKEVGSSFHDVSSQPWHTLPQPVEFFVVKVIAKVAVDGQIKGSVTVT